MDTLTYINRLIINPVSSFKIFSIIFCPDNQTEYRNVSASLRK